MKKILIFMLVSFNTLTKPQFKTCFRPTNI